jgi:hypothetical protein
MNHQLKQAACSYSERSGFRVRQHDLCPVTTLGPSTDDRCRCKVGRSVVPAVDAPELVTSRTIPLVDMPAVGAFPTAVAGIDVRVEHDTVTLTAVSDEQAKLVEGPRVVRPTLAVSNRCPVANSLEIFKGYPTTGVFRFTHQGLRNDVVDVGSESPFFMSTTLQQSFCGFRPFRLQLAAQAGVTFAERSDVSAGKHLAIAVDGKVLDAKINPDESLGFGRSRLFDIDRDIKKKRVIAINEIGLTARTSAEPFVVSAYQERHQRSTLKRQDRYPITALPGQHALIVGDSAVRSKSWLDVFIAFVTLDDLGYRSNRQLRRQPEIAPDVVVDQLLQDNLVGTAFAEGDDSDGITSSVESFHCSQERFRLCGRRLKLGLHRKFHGKEMEISLNDVKGLGIPPSAEADGFLPVIL